MNEETDTPETLADIIAEMRRFAAFAADRSRITPAPSLAAEQECHAAKLTKYADRLEAAAERETESLRVKAESEKRWACEYFDLARRREDALAHCKRYAQKIERENEEGETRLDAEEIIATVDNEFAGIRPDRAPGNAAAMREALERIVNLAPEYPADGVDWNALAAEAFLTASSALAAPARNCDRYATAAKAFHEWERYKTTAPIPPGGWCFGDAFTWLFDQAEGGDHA